MKKLIAITISFIISVGILMPTALAFSCSEVGTAKEGFFVILEEPIATSESEDVAFCFRVCKKEATDGKSLCDIKDACDTSTDSTCQRVQIIKAKSGTALIYTYVGMIYKWAAGTIGIVAVLIMVGSGIGIMTAGGDSGVIDKYKEYIMRSLIGLVVLFLSGLILYTINPTFFV